jgi:hypothetical protein
MHCRDDPGRLRALWPNILVHGGLAHGNMRVLSQGHYRSCPVLDPKRLGEAFTGQLAWLPR